MEHRANVLVLDNHSLVLEGICRVLSKLPEVCVADATTSSKDALCLIAQKKYDLYILEAGMSGISGDDLIGVIREYHPDARIIVNTMHEELWMADRILRSKVHAVVLKASSASELVRAVVSVLQGDTYLCPRFAALCQKLDKGGFSIVLHEKPTKRELEVLQAVAKGMNSYEIASLLGITVNTVETYRRKLISKFDARNATDLVVKAIAQGWVSVE